MEDIEKYRAKLQNYYNEDGKLIQYPSKRPMRVIALKKIAESFSLGEIYTEKDVNYYIRENIEFTDVEMIRREMFQYKILGRLRDGSRYWLEENWNEVL